MTPDEFRGHFPIFEARTYLNSCSQGALSTDVEASLDRFRHSWRDLGSPWDLWVAEVERLRGLVAGLLGAGEDEVAVMPNASVAIGAIATALEFGGDRDEVVLSELEFPTAAHVWLAQEPRGARIRWARPAESEQNRHRMAAIDSTTWNDAFAAAVTGRTRVVCATSIAYRTGFRTDLTAIGDVCRVHGALFFVDDYQRTGTGPLDVRALGVDFLVTGALKYLMGASGVAFLYVRRPLIERLHPAVTGWFGRVNPFDFRVDRLDWARSARRFETGSPPVPSVYAATAGVELLQQIGLPAIEQRITHLASLFISRLQAHGYATLTPPDPRRRGPLVVVRSADAFELTRRLAAAGIVTSARGDGVRVSFHAYNDERDVDVLCEALRGEEPLIVRV